MTIAYGYEDNHPLPEQPPGNKLLGSRANLTTMRASNRSQILNYLRRHRTSTSRVTIAKLFGFSRATVSSIIDELVRENLVIEGAKIQATQKGGKRATEIRFNAEAGYVVGIDIGRSRCRIYLANLCAEWIDQEVVDFNITDGAEEGLRSIIAKHVDDLVRERLETWDKVRGIGVSIPGTPDCNFQRLISPPTLASEMKFDIPQCLREALKLPEGTPIYLDNDANMGALGESRFGVGRGVQHFIYLKLSTGIGAGLILHGQLYRGHTGAAGEFGHVLVEEGHLPCPSCGKKGCLESVAGLQAIIKDAREGISSGRGREGRVEHTVSSIFDVIVRAQEGDADCKEALRHAGKRIGRAVGGSLINVYNPELILLDGGIIRPSKDGALLINDFLFDVLNASAQHSSLPVTAQGVKISLGELGDDAVGCGTVATVIDNDPWFQVADEKSSPLAVVN